MTETRRGWTHGDPEAHVLDSRTILITGAAGALGSVVARDLVAAGATVVAIDRHERVAHLSGKPGIVPAGADILDPADASRVVSEAVRDHGGIHGLVCLAGGFFGDTPVVHTPPDIARDQFERNYMTAYTMVFAALPAMVAGGGGSIVCVSSRPAVTTVAGSVAYASSKLAVLKLIEVIAAEHRDDGIRANAIVPSIIDTPANRSAMPQADHRRWVQPEEIAAVLKFLLSDDAAIVSGAHVPVYGRA